MADQQLVCSRCNCSFLFTEGEQEFYASKNLRAPARCKDCRMNSKNARLQQREMYQAVCGNCGAECEVPFKPRPVEEGGRPILCLNCFKAQKAV